MGGGRREIRSLPVVMKIISRQLGKIRRCRMRSVGESKRPDNKKRRGAYSYLKIHHLLRKRAHLIIEAEPIFTSLLCRKHRIDLSLVRVFHDDFSIRPVDIVVNIKGAARLHLREKWRQTLSILRASAREFWEFWA